MLSEELATLLAKRRSLEDNNSSSTLPLQPLAHEDFDRETGINYSPGNDLIQDDGATTSEGKKNDLSPLVKSKEKHSSNIKERIKLAKSRVSSPKKSQSIPRNSNQHDATSSVSSFSSKSTFTSPLNSSTKKSFRHEQSTNQILSPSVCEQSVKTTKSEPVGNLPTPTRIKFKNFKKKSSIMSKVVLDKESKSLQYKQTKKSEYILSKKNSQDFQNQDMDLNSKINLTVNKSHNTIQTPVDELTKRNEEREREGILLGENSCDETLESHELLQQANNSGSVTNLIRKFQQTSCEETPNLLETSSSNEKNYLEVVHETENKDVEVWDERLDEDSSRNHIDRSLRIPLSSSSSVQEEVKPIFEESSFQQENNMIETPNLVNVVADRVRGFEIKSWKKTSKSHDIHPKNLKTSTKKIEQSPTHPQVSCRNDLPSKSRITVESVREETETKEVIEPCSRFSRGSSITRTEEDLITLSNNSMISESSSFMSINVEDHEEDEPPDSLDVVRPISYKDTASALPSRTRERIPRWKRKIELANSLNNRRGVKIDAEIKLSSYLENEKSKLSPNLKSLLPSRKQYHTSNRRIGKLQESDSGVDDDALTTSTIAETDITSNFGNSNVYVRKLSEFPSSSSVSSSIATFDTHARLNHVSENTQETNFSRRQLSVIPSKPNCRKWLCCPSPVEINDGISNTNLKNNQLTDSSFVTETSVVKDKVANTRIYSSSAAIEVQNSSGSSSYSNLEKKSSDSLSLPRPYKAESSSKQSFRSTNADDDISLDSITREIRSRPWANGDSDSSYEQKNDSTLFTEDSISKDIDAGMSKVKSHLNVSTQCEIKSEKLLSPPRKIIQDKVNFDENIISPKYVYNSSSMNFDHNTSIFRSSAFYSCGIATGIGFHQMKEQQVLSGSFSFHQPQSSIPRSSFVDITQHDGSTNNGQQQPSYNHLLIENTKLRKELNYLKKSVDSDEGNQISRPELKRYQQEILHYQKELSIANLELCEKDQIILLLKQQLGIAADDPIDSHPFGNNEGQTIGNLNIDKVNLALDEHEYDGSMLSAYNTAQLTPQSQQRFLC